MRLLNVIVAAVFIVVFLFLPVFLFTQSPGTKARIEEKSNFWVLDKGLSNGVAVDLEGYLMKKTYSPKDRKFIQEKVAHFKVFRVFGVSCYAKVDRWLEGFSAKDAQWAQFLKPLVPPKGKKRKVEPVKAEKIEAGKTRRWYLNKGDNAFNLQKYDLAIDYYEKVLDKDPDDPGAILRMKKAKSKHFLHQGNLDYANQRYSSAYEYYMMAFDMRGEETAAAAEKIVDIWEKNREFYDKTKEFETSPELILEPLIKYCDTLLEEKRWDTLSVLAQKIKEFAETDRLKNKLDTLITAKEIQKDLEEGNYKKIVTAIETSINENNLYKAGYMIKKLDNLAADAETRSRLVDLKEELRSQKTQQEIRETIALKKEKIEKLEREAQAFIGIKDYDKAIARYMEIYKLDPDKKEYSDKIAELQEEKFKHEKSQEEIKAKVERDRLILYAEDYFQKDLMQDSLDYYIKAYKTFPEEGNAVAGVVKVLESCSTDDAKFLTPALLGRKQTKFTKDFLSYIEKEYLNSKDEAGFKILAKTVFITNNKHYDQLVRDFKSNLYAQNLKLGHEQFKVADFDKAAALYRKAKGFKDTPEINVRLRVSSQLIDVKNLMEQWNKKELSQLFDSITTHPYKYSILEGLLNLSEKYLELSDFKKARYLYKRVGDFQILKFKDRVSELKDKEKEMRKKVK